MWSARHLFHGHLDALGYRIRREGIEALPRAPLRLQLQDPRGCACEIRLVEKHLLGRDGCS